MATSNLNQGPQVGQIVLYNSSGTTLPAIIYSANASTWAVSIEFFNGSGANNATAVAFDPNFGSGTWRFVKFY